LVLLVAAAPLDLDQAREACGLAVGLELTDGPGQVNNRGLPEIRSNSFGLHHCIAKLDKSGVVMG
jgi:hypothetical protein